MSLVGVRHLLNVLHRAQSPLRYDQLAAFAWSGPTAQPAIRSQRHAEPPWRALPR